MQFNRISMELPILIFEKSQLEKNLHFGHEDLFLSLQTVHTLMKCCMMWHFTGSLMFSDVYRYLE